ncbi:hypothetical protein SAMN02745163_03912 [Clostridium cavendishii DSM 21758]|uniref:DUF4064 domain-containing protein n=1 Tax=Clostridium cavendishii DSM 21758 TaxID=1121302 RepID=A0A1M6SXH7_9CLOT|nr:hypothetical protein [Clostridium cavendishii]SHK49421.1 hypothetical protein SAMN02745163_03912 [Clostridium cavendishii DSM 21758]
MEEFKEQKVGAGIKTIAIISFIFQGLAIIGYIAIFAMKDTLEAMPGGEIYSKFTTTYTMLLMAFSIIEIVSLILILNKNKIGIFIYFGIVIIGFIMGSIQMGFSLTSLIGLILPGLMAYFIYAKREIFGFQVNNDSY